MEEVEEVVGGMRRHVGDGGGGGAGFYYSCLCLAIYEGDIY